MSKIAEKKALEAYPVKELKDCFGTRDINRCMREACIQGYDLAIQDLVSELNRRLKHNHARAEIDRSSCEMGMAKEDKDILDWLDTMYS